jgi:transcriptional regulator with XRE-family HTH domain
MTEPLPPNRLRELRGDLHLVEVAAVCKVGERTIRRWEAGEVAIPDEHKLTLAAHFGVTVEHLMGWDREPVDAGSAAA